MATKRDIKDAAYSELVTAMNNIASDSSLSVSITDAHDHVDVVDRENASEYPFVGMEDMGSTPISRGLHGHIYVHEVDTVNEVITYGRDEVLRLDCYAAVDNDDAALADSMLTHVKDRWIGYTLPNVDVGTFHSDVEDIEVNDSQSETSEQGRVSTEIEYTQYHTFDSWVTVGTVKQAFSGTNRTHTTTS